MDRRIHTIYALLLACALAGCNQAPAQAQTPAIQQQVSVVLIPKILEVKQAIQEVIPTAPTEPPADALTTQLITRWEIGSPALYDKLYQRPMWPGESSGITLGIGYDLGYSTPFRIGQEWQQHPQVEVMKTASGLVGLAAGMALPHYKVIMTPFPLADRVFRRFVLPSYVNAAERTLGPRFSELPTGAQAALVSLGYNRGWSMAGSRRSEMRVIRDTCVPVLDTACIAAELRSMKRLWPTSKGLRDRRDDEANTAER